MSYHRILTFKLTSATHQRYARMQSDDEGGIRMDGSFTDWRTDGFESWVQLFLDVPSCQLVQSPLVLNWSTSFSSYDDTGVSETQSVKLLATHALDY